MKHDRTPQKLKGKEVFQTYFVTSDEDPKLHKCRECSKAVKQDLTKGYNNLISHVTSSHKEDCFEKIRVFVTGVVEGPMDIFVRRSTEKAKNIFGWMEWIVTENPQQESYWKGTSICLTKRRITPPEF